MAGNDLIIDFDGDIKSPSKAVVCDQHGVPVSYIKYRYDPLCFNGKIPCEFTRYFSAAPNEDVGKMFTVRIKRLRLSKDLIPIDALNPLLAFKFKSIAFYSNDVLYWKGSPNAEPSRVLTAEEAARQMPANVASPHRQKYARVVLISILGFSMVAAVLIWRQTTKQTKQ